MIKVMTKEDEKLNKEYYELLKEHLAINSRDVVIKKRMAYIRTKIKPVERIVDERPDELTIKS